MAKFKGFIKCCEVCGTEFKVPPSQGRVRTCSRECGYKIRKHGNEKGKIELRCANCAKPFFTFPSHADRRKFCSSLCKDTSPDLIALRSARMSGEGNPGWKGGVSVRSTSSSGITYRRAQAHVEGEKIVRRKRAKDSATPSWARIGLMQEIYRLCREISRQTGVRHHVDHLVPLTSDLVCGLHVEHNLRIVPAVDNLRKHNLVWPDM